MKPKKLKGKDIADLRVIMEMTQSDLAHYLGYAHYTRVVEIENGKREVQKAETILLNILQAASKKEVIELTINKKTVITITARLKEKKHGKPDSIPSTN